MAAILLYHSVAVDVADSQLQVHPETILRHLDWCALHGYEAAPLADALSQFGRESGRRHVRRRFRELPARLAGLACAGNPADDFRLPRQGRR